MAIWQFRLDFLPKQEVQSIEPHVPEVLSKDTLDDFPWWSHVQPPKGFEDYIDKVVPRTRSWSDSMTIWGDEDSNMINVSYTDETKSHVEFIWCRVDVRNITHSFITGICRLAQQLGCIFVTAKRLVLGPDEATILSAINESNAKRYLEDPVSALIEMKERGDTIKISGVPDKTISKKPN